MNSPTLAADLRRPVRGGALAALALLLAACASAPQRPDASTPSPLPEIEAAPVEPLPAPPVDPLRTLPPDPYQRFADGLQGLDCAHAPLADARPYSAAYLQRMLGTVGPMFGYVVEQMQTAQLPTQLALIPLLESGLRADPGNRGAHRGMWQFAAATGRRFGLQIGASYDGRLSSVESTDAALRHLGDMWRRYADWRWTVAGYNAGEQRINKLLQRHLRQGELDAAGVIANLPRHTRDYLKRMAAIACWLRDPGPPAALREQARRQALRRAEIAHGAATLEAAAQMLGSDSATLRRLNPALAQARFPLAAAHPVLVPAGAAAASGVDVGVAAASAAPASAPPAPAPAAAVASAPQQHTVARGDSLWTIARRYGVSIAALRRWNGLSRSSLIRPGQRLQVEP